MQIHPDIQRQAMRLVRPVVIRAIKDNGLRLSMISTNDINKCCFTLITHPDAPEFIQKAWDICKMRWEKQRV